LRCWNFVMRFSLLIPLRRVAFALLMGLLLLATHATAQVCGIPGKDGEATLSGVLNSYHAGSGSSSANQVTVASTSGQRSNTRALQVGDLVLVIQMQDATSPANAGLHEYANIVAITGNTLTLNRTLTNNYVQNVTTNLVRTFQVVYVPQYASALLSGAVTADRWTLATGTGAGTGGIVAMDVAGSLSLTGSINVNGAGFRGGAGINGTGNRVGGLFTDADFAFAPGAANGAIKGEGITGTPIGVFDGTAVPVDYATLLTQGYAAGAGGRAAQGNAGGGGNDGEPVGGGNQYNSGGGGGSNGGTGGQGGYSWSQRNDAGGRGAVAVATSVTRLVLGGGGGAGSSNNNGNTNAVTTWPPVDNATTRPLPPTTGTTNGADGVITVSGAPGGGMVLIRAGTLTGAGTINADGYTAFNTSGGSEGAGGGGAGGTVAVLSGNATSGALTINANGGKGGYSNYFDHGPGGGGGGGVVVTNFATATVNRAGGDNGYDGCCGGVQGNSSPKAYTSTVGTIGVLSTAGGTPTGVLAGADCLPVLQVTKTSLLPTVTAAVGATTTYSINISNSGGAATNLYLLDANLPPGWAYTSTPATTYSYSPIPPGAASAGADTTAATLPVGLPVSSASTVNSAVAISLRANGVAPGVVPATGSNSPTFGSFFVPQNGSVTVTYAVSIPDTATAGTYHNPAGVIFLDPTRTAANPLRMVTPQTSANANRAGLNYSANTSYASGSTTNVTGNNFSGLQAGPASDNVVLLPDLSVTKSLSTTTFTLGGANLQYVLAGRNNGRPVANQIYANTQATGQSATAIVSTLPTITDTLPVGMTLTALTNSNPGVWTCTPNGTSTTFACSASAAVYPMPASSNLVTITASVSVSAAACPGPQTNTVVITSAAISESSLTNNTASVATPISCNANLSVSKTNNTTTLVAGSTTSYTVTVSNLGPAASDNGVLRDTPSVGLSACTVTACTATGTGICPAPGLWPNVFTGGGLVLGSFASGATLSFTITCNVTATGQ
jgi:uncharacterized repeat protein (TIGR01451 family)